MEEQQHNISNPAEKGYSELGQLVRRLHETLQEMGCDEAIQHAVGELPDARDRLNHIAQLTEQAAQSTLTAVEKALPLQERMETDALALTGEWHAATDDGAKLRVGEKMQVFLEGLPGHTRETSSQLTEIMMAQGFQDLTGQMIKKVINMAQNLEQQLVHVLLISKPTETAKTDGQDALYGPAANTQGRTDMVSNQGEVDDLLSSLGF